MFSNQDTYIILAVITIGCVLMVYLMTRTPPYEPLVAELLQELIRIQEEELGRKLKDWEVDVAEKFARAQVKKDPKKIAAKVKWLQENKE